MIFAQAHTCCRLHVFRKKPRRPSRRRCILSHYRLCFHLVKPSFMSTVCVCACGCTCVCACVRACVFLPSFLGACELSSFTHGCEYMHAFTCELSNTHMHICIHILFFSIHACIHTLSIECMYAFACCLPNTCIRMLSFGNMYTFTCHESFVC